MPTRVLLVDDHAIIRQGLASLLEKHSDIEVVGNVEDGRKAVDIARKLAPAIVIMDISMPNLNGIDATRKIVAEMGNVKVIALSIHSSRHFVAEMLKAGASGYILKECLFDELVEAIKTVLNGGTYLSPRITGVVLDDYVKRLSTQYQPEGPVLNEREREVLQFLSGRQEHQTNRPAAPRQRQDHRVESAKHYGQTRYQQRGGAYQICRPRGIDAPGIIRRLITIFVPLPWHKIVSIYDTNPPTFPS